MNPDLALLQPYPFERLRRLYDGVTPPKDLKPIDLSIGEPKHPTPQLVFDGLTAGFAGLASYPPTLGTDALRGAIAGWLERRYGLPKVDAATQVLPVCGSREGLFSFAQAAIDRTRAPQAANDQSSVPKAANNQSSAPLVVIPNPFYQIYEGATLLAGAQPLYLPATPANGFRMAFDRIEPEQWKRVQLVFVCTPGNPHGRVMTQDEWRELFGLADRHDFVIASDECYSEIYFDEGRAPLGGLQAAHALGRDRFDRLVVFGSLSKRSNAPGLRSGYVAGDAALLKQFLLYRTYHGNAMSLAVQSASLAAWNDERHVVDNRRLYAAKFAQATPIIRRALKVEQPEAAFFLWAQTPIDDETWARRLYEQCHIKVLPGTYLSRASQTGDGLMPGKGFVRMALVAPEAEVIEAAHRIVNFKP